MIASTAASVIGSLTALVREKSEHFTNHSLDLGWGALARRLTIEQVPGDHALFKDDRLAALATALGELLGTVDHKAHTAGYAQPNIHEFFGSFFEKKNKKESASF